MTLILPRARFGRGIVAGLLGLAAMLLAAPALAQGAPDFPALSGRVVDQADLLDPATERALTDKLAALEAGSTDQLVVVTVSSLQDREIEDYGYQLGRAWGIGQKENDNGALLIVAPNERKVRIEVGYGLEPILTDAFSTQVIQGDILPAFREGDYRAGIVRGVDALVAQLSLDPAEAEARAAAAAESQVGPKAPIAPLIIVGLVFLFIFLAAVGGAGRGRRHRRGGVSPILIWAASEALRSSSRGGWGGGGGFGGGGGSFGGGGASGGW